MDQNLKFKVHTFGCKVNTYDTGLIQKNLSASGFLQETVEKSAKPNIHVLNTCSVTGEATKQAVKLIRKLKSKEPLATVVVTGCAAQVDTEHFRNLPGADLVVANSHKALLPQIIDDFFKGKIQDKVFKSNIFRKEDLESGGGVESSHSRSFLKIQDGCNSFCSYCIIPYARGKSRSIPKAELLKRILELQTFGIREVVLTGVHIGDYEDAGAGFEDLVEYLLNKTMGIRYRLSSLEPVEVSQRLLALFKDSRLCPHFHMSIQSAEDVTLKLMKRNYGQAEVISSLKAIEALVPGAYVGMDVIVGFPTETKEQFEQTFEVLKNTPWTKLHVFPYSERHGTKAATFEETVPLEERARRSKILRNLSFQRVEMHAGKQIGLNKSVLVLKKSKGYHGIAEDYWPVRIQGSEEFLDHWAGQMVNVRVSGYEMNENLPAEAVLIAEVLV